MSQRMFIKRTLLAMDPKFVHGHRLLLNYKFNAMRIFKLAAPDCARILVMMATDHKVDPRLRLNAAETILDRVLGKVSQPSDSEASGNGGTICIKHNGEPVN